MRRKLIFLLYRTLLAAAFPLVILYLLRRGLKQPRYFREIHERFGWLPHSFERTAAGAIWLHAVSVGEALSAAPLIADLRRRFPLAPIYVSSGTLAGRAAAVERLGELADGVFYAPLDYVFAVRRVLRTIRPLALVVLETEIWPNLFREAKRAGAGLMVANGRISEKAVASYVKYRWFFREVLSLPDEILVQGDQDRGRYLSAGAPPEKVRVAGNLKYDFEPREIPLERNGPLWIAGSTVGPEYEGDTDEDDAVIAAFHELKARQPDLQLIIAPRKPERFPVVAGKLEAAGLPFLRRSLLTRPDLSAGILLLDTIGELGGLFGSADVVFIGGSLAHRGGHNILEPALFGRPVVIGPHMENFPDIAQKFVANGGCVQIQHPGELAGVVGDVLADASKRAELGIAARHLANQERGAARRAADAIAAAYENAVPCTLPYGWLSPALSALSFAWRAGGARKRRRALRDSARLHTPVVSIGGISMGGTGKTPLTAYLSRQLRRSGLEPAVLTRGYKRRTPERVTLLSRGSGAPVSLTGDEAQILLRRGDAHLGVAKDRAAAGYQMEVRLRPGVFLLDDGFQHAQLGRDLDIVLIDSLDPFGGCALFPRGRLREPLEALSRAGAFVISRTAENREYAGIERMIRKFNVRAPIFRSSVVARAWVNESGSRKAAELGIGRIAGLDDEEHAIETAARSRLGANPDHFVVRYRELFGDHISADNAAELFAEYSWSETARSRFRRAVAHPAGWLANAVFLQRLADPAGPGVAAFTGGGNAAGKTLTVHGLLDEGALVYDSTLSEPDESMRLIDAALQHGKRVAIVYVHADPIRAYRFAIQRALNEGAGRLLSIAEHVLSHRNAARTIIALAARYAEVSGLGIQVLANQGRPEDFRTCGLDVPRTQDYSEISEALQEYVGEIRLRGELPLELYRAATGAGAAGEPGPVFPGGSVSGEEIRGPYGTVAGGFASSRLSQTEGLHRPLSVPYLPYAPVAAFCGLANPSSFWTTLDRLGCRPVFQWRFSNHHHYRPGELRQLAERARRAGAAVLVTTEKDAVNLPAGYEGLLAGLPLFYLEIGTQLDRPEQLLDLVLESSKKRLREETRLV